MKSLYAQVLDPSGYHRVIKLTQFPYLWGTSLENSTGLRDAKIGNESLNVEVRGEVFILKVLQPDLVVSIGDLKFQSLEIPMGVRVRIGETEITFSEHNPKSTETQQKAGDWLTVSESGLNLLQSLRKSSLTKLSIYLCGETGTGKEVLAKMIHEQSPRSTGAFVAINCGALALSLVESELFGHVKGAYTGAVRDRPGALLQAQGGTLFLDEVGDLPSEVQVKLLRFLESGEIRPVGGDRLLHANVRVVCATHKPLLKLVKEGKFRQDLYYRLASIPLEISPLRSRPEDIDLLAHQFARAQGKSITQEALRKLRMYAWPGNVRELLHSIERAAGIVGPFETVIHEQDLHFLSEIGEDETQPLVMPGICRLDEMEKIMILRALKASVGNRSEAAKILGVARSTLFEMMKRHRIVGPKTVNYWTLPTQ